MKTVVLAYTGDLESMVAIHWLVHHRDLRVVVLAADIGQGIYMEPLGEAALELGAQAAHIFDLRDRFVREFCFPALRAGAVLRGRCFLGAALERYLVASELVRVAHEESCDGVAHAFTGKGNDQLRVEMAVAALDPDLPVIAPVREWPMKSREELRAYVRRYDLPAESLSRDPYPYRVNRNIWGTVTLGGALEDPWQEPGPEVHHLTVAPARASNTPTEVVVGFENGLPCSLDEKPYPPVELVDTLSRLAGSHGVGRLESMDDRLTGLKSREVYELPAAWVLYLCHEALESLVFTREMIELGRLVSDRYANLIYRGHWYTDARPALDAFFAEGQKVVTGEVRVRLHKGRCEIIGRRSPHSLYDPKLATYESGDAFDYEASRGFARLSTLPSRVFGRRRQARRESSWPPSG